MTALATQEDRPGPITAKRTGTGNSKARAAGNLVSANTLATHLACTRQNIERLRAEGIIERRTDGRYDQAASRLRYIKHLRAEHRRSPRTEADAAFVQAKADLIRLRIAEKQRDLIPAEEALATVDAICGVMLTHLSSMPARIGGNDLQLRRRVERAVYDTRVAIATEAQRQADEYGKPRGDDTA